MLDDGWMQRWCKKQGIFDSSAGFLCFSVASLHFIFHFIYFGAFRGKKRDILPYTYDRGRNIIWIQTP